MPVVDIRLVPYLEVPLQHVLLAVAFYEVCGNNTDELTPLLIVLRRIVRGSADGALRVVHLIGHLTVRQIGREVFGHETELDHWTDTCGFVLVKDAIENGEIVDRLARSIFAIHVCRTEL